MTYPSDAEPPGMAARCENKAARRPACRVSLPGHRSGL
ncbi:hypothetical protein LA6_001079 [Marinibacterium anthonyi]|nr:hypothetical protein LA6_001079 [Marinibacterium anthonyi]